jgi:hypothetical protein
MLRVLDKVTSMGSKDDDTSMDSKDDDDRNKVPV